MKMEYMVLCHCRIISPIFPNINTGPSGTKNTDPSGTKNDTSMDIFCEYGYQEMLG